LASAGSRGPSHWCVGLWFRRVDDRRREARQDGASQRRDWDIKLVHGQLETVEAQAAMLLGFSNPIPRIGDEVTILKLQGLIHVGVPPQELVDPARDRVLAVRMDDGSVKTSLNQWKSQKK
jgi:hypothetical protein